MLTGFNLTSEALRRAAVLCGLLLSLTLSGCGSAKQPWEHVVPAKGKVLRNGKPVADAEISLFPEDSSIPDSVRPRAKSDQNGEFVVWTYETGDGAPAGSYKVTVVHHEVTVSKDTLVTKPNDLPRKYATLESTDLVVTVGTGPTEIPPLDLK